MTIRHQHELEGLRRAGTLVAGILAAMREPLLATHCSRTREGSDGWPMVCPRGVAAQFGHTVVVIRGEPIIVT